MLPLLALLAPVAATVLETIELAAGTAVAVTVATRVTNDIYDAAKKKEEDDES